MWPLQLPPTSFMWVRKKCPSYLAPHYCWHLTPTNSRWLPVHKALSQRMCLGLSFLSFSCPSVFYLIYISHPDPGWIQPFSFFVPNFKWPNVLPGEKNDITRKHGTTVNSERATTNGFLHCPQWSWYVSASFHVSLLQSNTLLTLLTSLHTSTCPCLSADDVGSSLAVTVGPLQGEALFSMLSWYSRRRSWSSHLAGECKKLPPLWKPVQWFIIKLNTHFPENPLKRN